MADIRVLGGILEPNTRGAVYEYTPPKGTESVVKEDVTEDTQVQKPDETAVMTKVDVYGPLYWTALTNWEGKTEADRAMQRAASVAEIHNYFGGHRRGGNVATRIAARAQRDKFFADLSNRTEPIHLPEMSEIVRAHPDDRFPPRETKLVPVRKNRRERFFFWTAWVGSVLITSSGLTFMAIGVMNVLGK